MRYGTVRYGTVLPQSRFLMAAVASAAAELPGVLSECQAAVERFFASMCVRAAPCSVALLKHPFRGGRRSAGGVESPVSAAEAARNRPPVPSFVPAGTLAAHFRRPPLHPGVRNPILGDLDAIAALVARAKLLLTQAEWAALPCSLSAATDCAAVQAAADTAHATHAATLARTQAALHAALHALDGPRHVP